jgi:hypothetical protein
VKRSSIALVIAGLAFCLIHGSVIAEPLKLTPAQQQVYQNLTPEQQKAFQTYTPEQQQLAIKALDTNAPDSERAQAGMDLQKSLSSATATSNASSNSATGTTTTTATGTAAATSTETATPTQAATATQTSTPTDKSADDPSAPFNNKNQGAFVGGPLGEKDVRDIEIGSDQDVKDYLSPPATPPDTASATNTDTSGAPPPSPASTSSDTASATNTDTSGAPPPSPLLDANPDAANSQLQSLADQSQDLANKTQGSDPTLAGQLSDLSNLLSDLSQQTPPVSPSLSVVGTPTSNMDYAQLLANARTAMAAGQACLTNPATCAGGASTVNQIVEGMRKTSAGRSAVSGRSGATLPPSPSNNSTITSSANPGAGCGGPGVPGGCSGGGGGATSPTPPNNNQATGANATEKHVAVGNVSQPTNGAVQSKVPSSPSTTVRSTAPSLSGRAASTAAANAANRAASNAAGRAASNAAANAASRTASNSAANAASRAASNAAANAASRAASNVASRIHLPTVSDIRLKRDVAQVGQLPDGLHLYRFRYLWSDTVYVGVMAQEALAIEPEAVVRGQDGYLRVDYDRIGFKFSTWKEWVGRAPERLN